MLDQHNDLEQIKEFITAHPAVALATASADGHPNGTIIYCMVSDDGTLDFMTLSDTSKAKDLAENPRATVVAFDVAAGITAKVGGSVNQMTDTNQQVQLFNWIMAATARIEGDRLPPVTQLHAGAYSYYRVTPEQWVLSSYS